MGRIAFLNTFLNKTYELIPEEQFGRVKLVRKRESDSREKRSNQCYFCSGEVRGSLEDSLLHGISFQGKSP